MLAAAAGCNRHSSSLCLRTDRSTSCETYSSRRSNQQFRTRTADADCNSQQMPFWFARHQGHYVKLDYAGRSLKFPDIATMTDDLGGQRCVLATSALLNYSEDFSACRLEAWTSKLPHVCSVQEPDLRRLQLVRMEAASTSSGPRHTPLQYLAPTTGMRGTTLAPRKQSLMVPVSPDPRDTDQRV